MTRPNDETLLRFLEHSLSEGEREALLQEMDGDPSLAAEIQEMAHALEALQRAADQDRAGGSGNGPNGAGGESRVHFGEPSGLGNGRWWAWTSFKLVDSAYAHLPEALAGLQSGFQGVF